MTSILDSVLDQPVTHTQIVSEQHDPSKINIGNVSGSVRDQINRLKANPSSWDAAEYGITIEAQIAKLELADTPEARAIELNAMRQRALSRASLDITNGRISLVTAGKLPWHGLGVNVTEAMQWLQAYDLGNLRWDVNKRPLQYVGPKGTFSVPDQYALVRSDTGRVFDVCKTYEPIQNHEMFAFLDEVLGSVGAHYEVAGAIYGGETIFVVAKLPNQSFAVGGTDQQDSHVVFTNGHKVGKAAKCFPTSTRPECANSLRIAVGKDAKKGITIAHTGDMKTKINVAKRALGIAVAELDKYKVNCETMIRKPMKIEHYANQVLDAVLDVTAADCKLGANALAAVLDVSDAEKKLAEAKFEKKITRRGEILEDIFECYESDHNAKRGTAWGCFNAITDHADHNSIGKQAKDAELRQSRRFESSMVGASDEMKQVAYQLALAN